MLPSPSHQGPGLRSFARSWLPVRSLPLRPGNSPTIPKDGRVDGPQNVGLPSSCHLTGRPGPAWVNEQARCQSSVLQPVGVSLAFTASYVRRRDFGQREISGRMQMFAGQPKFRGRVQDVCKAQGEISLARSCKRRKAFVWVSCGGPAGRDPKPSSAWTIPPFGVHGSDDAVARVMLKDRKS